MLLYLLGVLFVVVGIGVSIALHEIGHLAPAKAFGVKCSQYMIGFGPTLWSRRRGETEYGIKAIPLGGYVRMLGMFPPSSVAADPSVATGLPVDGDAPQLRVPERSGRWSAMIEDARHQSMAEVGPEDGDRVFYKLPIRKRIVVMLGGPTMNLLLAIVLMTIVVSIIGLPQTTTKVGAVAPCVPTASDAGGTKVNGACPAGPSAATVAGIQVGDQIVSFNGTPITEWTQAQSAIRQSPAGEVPVVVIRNGVEQTLTVDLKPVQLPVYGTDGKPTGATESRNFVGLVPGFERQTDSVATVPGIMWDQATHAVSAIVTLPVRISISRPHLIATFLFAAVCAKAHTPKKTSSRQPVRTSSSFFI